MKLRVGDIVFYQGSYYKIVFVHPSGRMIDIENDLERINQVYASDCEKVNV